MRGGSGRLVLAGHRVGESARRLLYLSEGVGDVGSTRARDRAIQSRDGRVEAIPELARSPPTRTGSQFIGGFGMFGPGHRTPQQSRRMGVLPCDLLPLRRLG